MQIIFPKYGGGGLKLLPKAKVGDLLTCDDEIIAENNGDYSSPSFMSSITALNI